MKYTQKTKYFIYGVLGTAVLVPLGTYAVKTIPVTFSEGDVLSASVLNSLMDRINDTQQGFSAATDLVGTWSCVTYTAEPTNTCVGAWTSTGTGLYSSRSQNITFTCSGGSCSWTAPTFYPGSCDGTTNGARTLTQDFDVLGNTIASRSTGGSWPIVSTYQKRSPTTFIWNISANSVPNTVSYCDKNNQAPAPANALSATVSGTSVALAWTDQSTDETGFKVQYKTSAKGSWTTATTTAANATSYTITGLSSSTYWIRVLAKNSNGDSMSSSETQAVVQ